MNKKRRGSFSIPMNMVKNNPSLVKRILSQCIIFRAEMLWQNDSIEYHAECHLFRPQKTGECLPEYSWQVFNDGWVEPREIVQGRTY